MPGLAGWKPFRRQARQFLSRMNLAKKQNSEANRMKKKTDAAAAKKTGSSEDSATEKALRPRGGEYLGGGEAGRDGADGGGEDGQDGRGGAVGGGDGGPGPLV